MILLFRLACQSAKEMGSNFERIPEGKGPYSVGCTDLMTGHSIQVSAAVKSSDFLLAPKAAYAKQNEGDPKYKLIDLTAIYVELCIVPPCGP